MPRSGPDGDLAEALDDAPARASSPSGGTASNLLKVTAGGRRRPGPDPSPPRRGAGDPDQRARGDADRALRGQPDAGPPAAGRRGHRRGDPRPLRGRRACACRRPGCARARSSSRTTLAAGLARPAAGAGPRLARPDPCDGRRRQRPATTRPEPAPEARPGDAAPGHARWSAAGGPPPARDRRGSDRWPRSRAGSGRRPCSTRKVRASEAVTSASCISPRWSWRAVDPRDERRRLRPERLAHELERVAQPLAGDAQVVERLDVGPAQDRLVGAHALVGRPDARRRGVADAMRRRPARPAGRPRPRSARSRR